VTSVLTEWGFFVADNGNEVVSGKTRRKKNEDKENVIKRKVRTYFQKLSETKVETKW
jgi:hypothetical protein